jgi:Fe2+ transport system protein FeoA
MIFNFRQATIAEKPGVAALADLPKGYAAVVATVDDELAELTEIGFVPGAHVKPTHSGMGGDPTVYEVDGALVALRRAAACHVYVTLPDEFAQEGD